MMGLKEIKRKERSEVMRYALLGAAGYIAPRHMRAIRDTGGELVSAMDPFDSVGILDSYAPSCHFTMRFEEFAEYNAHLQRGGAGVDYVSICTPNFLHEVHACQSLAMGAGVICEKPLTLTESSLDRMCSASEKAGLPLYTILQLRLHDSIVALRKRVLEDAKDKVYDIDLTYITSRGSWYDMSWKGDSTKSGGIVLNIGVHFFDMLTWIFGSVDSCRVHVRTDSVCAGFLDLERARVRFFLSIDARTLPENAVEGEKRTYRLIEIGGESFEFSRGFTELHTESYKRILAGEGFEAESVRDTIGLCERINNSRVLGLQGDYHPLLTQFDWLV